MKRIKSKLALLLAVAAVLSIQMVTVSYAASNTNVDSETKNTQITEVAKKKATRPNINQGKHINPKAKSILKKGERKTERGCILRKPIDHEKVIKKVK